jgi:hypothetical protein
LAAVLVMFGCGLFMAAYLLHAYLVFAVAWWLVLNGIALQLCRTSGPNDGPLTEISQTPKPLAAAGTRCSCF